ncbi:MAG: aldo/keto reductase [Clostridia bacterium]
MQYREIPKTGEKLSILGYGCMRFQTKFGKIDVETAKSQVLQAIDDGVNYLDTAWFYHVGESENFLGKHILIDGYREKVNIATKMPCFLVNKTSQFEEIFEKQRKKLNVDVIDYYLLHTLDGRTFDKMVDLGIIDFMNNLKSSGRIRNMGFSFHSSYEDFEHIINSYDWDFCQVQFNILDENYQAGIRGINLAHQMGLGVFIMEPLRGGSLVGKIPKEVQKLYDTADIKRQPADWMLRWVFDHNQVTMVLSGMNSQSQVKENIETATNSLPNSMTDKEKSIISNVRDTYNKLMLVKCTGCEYCLPCPAGIDIPNAFKALNNKSMFKSRLSDIFYLKSVGINYDGDKPSWASTCIGCGKCEKACPQHIEIRKNLKLVHKNLETPIYLTGTKIAAKFMRKNR